MLEIRNLHVRVEDKEILRGLDLKINAGEVHSIMGPNGSGKSTLAQVLAGRDRGGHGQAQRHRNDHRQHKADQGSVEAQPHVLP